MDLTIKACSHCMSARARWRGLVNILAGARGSAYRLADRIISHTLGREGQLTVCVLVHIACIMCKSGHAPSLFVMTSILLMPLPVGILCCLQTNSPIRICNAESTCSTSNRGDGCCRQGSFGRRPACTLHVTCMSAAQQMAVMGSMLPPNCST